MSMEIESGYNSLLAVIFFFKRWLEKRQGLRAQRSAVQVKEQRSWVLPVFARQWPSPAKLWGLGQLWGWRWEEIPQTAVQTGGRLLLVYEEENANMNSKGLIKNIALLYIIACFSYRRPVLVTRMMMRKIRKVLPRNPRRQTKLLKSQTKWLMNGKLQLKRNPLSGSSEKSLRPLRQLWPQPRGKESASVDIK